VVPANRGEPGLDLDQQLHRHRGHWLFEDEHRRIREELLRSEILAATERAARELAETRATLVGELERKNRELEAFSYSVSHDLRAPLRSIDGFSQAILEDNGDQLDAQGKSYLVRVRAAAQRMARLIDDQFQHGLARTAGQRVAHWRELADIDINRAVFRRLLFGQTARGDRRRGENRRRYVAQRDGARVVAE